MNKSEIYFAGMVTSITINLIILLYALMMTAIANDLKEVIWQNKCHEVNERLFP